MTHFDKDRREGPGRREVLGGLAVTGAGLLFPGHHATAQNAAAAAKPHRIDVHHHLAPPDYAAEFIAKNLLGPPLRGWTPEISLADMDKAGVATAILSITNPGVWTGKVEDAYRLARQCNDYAARLVTDYPGRFGMFAVLPMPDIEGSLKEIAYALDVLKADGIGLYTSYGDKWLGDPAFDPIFDELNRRKAVVYTHPVLANCCRNLLPNIPPNVVEYSTDTTRAITLMMFGGTAARCPDISIIWSHAGGTMPSMVERYLVLAKDPKMAPMVPKGPLHELQRFYYDTAQASNAAALSLLTRFVSVSQILFGTDFPFRNSPEHVQGLIEGGVFSVAELRAIDRENALRLLPRLKA